MFPELSRIAPAGNTEDGVVGPALTLPLPPDPPQLLHTPPAEHCGH